MEAAIKKRIEEKIKYFEKNCINLIKFLSKVYNIPEKNVSKFLFKEIWYRGEEAEFEYPLLPTLFRKYDKNFNKNIEISKIEDIEVEMYEKAKVNPEIKEIFSIKENFISIELLSYLRHLGISSRILDFTKDLEVALYFSIREKKPGFLYILFPRILNLQIGMGASLGLIPNANTIFPLKARLFCSMHTEIFPYIRDLGINLDLFNKDIEKLKKISENIKIYNHFFKKFDNEFSFIKIHKTPLAVEFYPLHSIMLNQKAVAVLFGGFLSDDDNIFLYKKEKSQNFKVVQDEDHIYIPKMFKCNISPIIKINLSELDINIEHINLNPYYVYGYDPRYIEEGVLAEKNLNKNTI